MASASPSFQPRRASWPITLRASRTWAAKCSVGCSDRQRGTTMSRIGKKPVPVPAGVTAKVDGQKVSVKGPKGELNFTVPDDVAVALENGEIKVDPRSEP